MFHRLNIYEYTIEETGTGRKITSDIYLNINFVGNGSHSVMI